MTNQIIWMASYYVSRPKALGTNHILGTFETKELCEEAFREAGFTRRPSSTESQIWVKPNCTGYVTKTVKEI